MNKTHLGARLLLALAFVNGLFHLTMLSFNILGIPMGLIH
jgi:hypothetical protein